MREIKFRAWSKERETMIHADESGWYHKAFIGKNGFWQTTQLDTIIKHPQIIPSQYTGLKDKNGKEIYEGDVVAVSEEYGGHAYTPLIVDFKDCCFVLRRINYMADYSPMFNFDFTQIYEVIGNQFENPELLEQTT